MTKDGLHAIDQQVIAFQQQIERLQSKNVELQRQLNRFSNPWTVEIQNQSDGCWTELAHDAPLTLGDAEARMLEHQIESPRAKFRVVPWLNNSQRPLLAELQRKYDAAYGIIRSLEAKLAAAEADTTRLDRVIEDLKRCFLKGDCCFLRGSAKYGWDYEGSGAIGAGSTPREAIDAARGEKGK
jgi:hypothetical protein